MALQRISGSAKGRQVRSGSTLNAKGELEPGGHEFDQFVSTSAPTHLGGFTGCRQTALPVGCPGELSGAPRRFPMNDFSRPPGHAPRSIQRSFPKKGSSGLLKRRHSGRPRSDPEYLMHHKNPHSPSVLDACPRPFTGSSERGRASRTEGSCGSFSCLGPAHCVVVTSCRRPNSPEMNGLAMQS